MTVPEVQVLHGTSSDQRLLGVVQHVSLCVHADLVVGDVHPCKHIVCEVASTWSFFGDHHLIDKGWTRAAAGGVDKPERNTIPSA